MRGTKSVDFYGLNLHLSWAGAGRRRPRIRSSTIQNNRIQTDSAATGKTGLRGTCPPRAHISAASGTHTSDWAIQRRRSVTQRIRVSATCAGTCVVLHCNNNLHPSVHQCSLYRASVLATATKSSAWTLRAPCTGHTSFHQLWTPHVSGFSEDVTCEGKVYRGSLHGDHKQRRSYIVITFFKNLNSTFVSFRQLKQKIT
jgi:hypothetical protein